LFAALLEAAKRGADLIGADRAGEAESKFCRNRIGLDEKVFEERIKAGMLLQRGAKITVESRPRHRFDLARGDVGSDADHTAGAESDKGKGEAVVAAEDRYRVSDSSAHLVDTVARTSGFFEVVDVVV